MELTVIVERDCLNAHAVQDITQPRDILLRVGVHRVVLDTDVLEDRTKSPVMLVITALEASLRLLLV